MAVGVSSHQKQGFSEQYYSSQEQATPTTAHILPLLSSETRPSSSKHRDYLFTPSDHGVQSSPTVSTHLNIVRYSSADKSSSMFLSKTAHSILVSDPPPRTAVSATPSHVLTMPPSWHTPSFNVAPSMSLSLLTSTVSDHITSSLPSPSHPTSLTTPTSPSSSGGLTLAVRLVLYVVPPVGGVLTCVVCVTLIICFRKYRR